MRLTIQKKLASRLMKASKKRIRFDTERLDDIKEAITKRDVKGLINDGVIIAVQKKGISKARVNPGRNRLKKGKATARTPGKREWVNKIRALRQMIKVLKDKKLITQEAAKELYLKAKGGFFRTKRHMRLYIDEKRFIKKN